MSPLTRCKDFYFSCLFFHSDKVLRSAFGEIAQAFCANTDFSITGSKWHLFLCRECCCKIFFIFGDDVLRWPYFYYSYFCSTCRWISNVVCLIRTYLMFTDFMIFPWFLCVRFTASVFTEWNKIRTFLFFFYRLWFIKDRVFVS